jgi:ComF family protein
MPSPLPFGDVRAALARIAALARVAAGSRCAVCRAWGADARHGLCGFCARRVAAPRTRCDGCARPLPPPSSPDAAGRCGPCQRAAPPWSRVVAGVDYGHPWDRLLAGFKFGDRPGFADVLAAPLLARLRESGVDAGLRVLPVPLARGRLRERGYNQSWELARRLARALALEARADALVRLRDTAHQLHLPRAERSANVADAFLCAPAQAAWVRGARDALVDDVLTTGATARAATRALRAAGALEVELWVAARTPG